MAGELDVVSMPYPDRQMLVVGADFVVSTQRATERASEEPRSFKVQLLASLATGFVGPAGLIIEGLELYKKARASELEILLVSRTEAKTLRFPVGHPRDRLVYVGHPADPGVYVPMADFHRFLFEHKMAEALRLVRSLGAREIEIEHITGWRNRDEVGIGLSLPIVDTVDAKLEAARSAAQGRRILSRMSLQPTLDAYVPDGLVWYDHEPLWKEVAQARVEGGLQSFQLDVTYADDFGVTAGLKASVAKVGLEVGGSFTEHRSTIWRLGGTF